MILFILLALFCTIMFVIGVIDPSKALIPFATRGRGQAALVWFSAALLCLIIVGVSAGDKSTPADNQTEDAATEIAADANTNSTPETSIDPTSAPAATSVNYSSGMYKIGVDLPAGEYKLYENGYLGSAYFEIDKDSTGTLDSIIANDNFPNFVYVSVSDGQYLQYTDAYAVAVADVEPYQPTDGKYVEGMYKVGYDIPAGEYKLISETDYSYYEVCSDSLHTLDSIISNELFDSDIYVTVSDGQYLYFIGCYIAN